MTMPTATTVDPALRERLRLVLLRLARRVRQEAGQGVTPSQFSALASISRVGPLRLGALAEHERVSNPTLTRIVVALEEAGYVERRRDHADGRCSQVGVTAAGQRVLAEYRERADAYLTRQLAALEQEDRDAIAGALPALERLLEVED